VWLEASVRGGQRAPDRRALASERTSIQGLADLVMGLMGALGSAPPAA